jgi:hypothetical protein
MKIKIYTTDKNGTATISKNEADSITINADNLINKLKQHEYYI